MEKINQTGRRKTAVARVFLSEGTGKITINNRDYKEYFSVPHLQENVVMPFKLTQSEGKYDVQVNVYGGGIKGQAEAVRLGISRCLITDVEDNRKLLKPHGLLTRDARKVERKKPGLRKARRRSQFSKR
ncbi:MAG: 30S ribosomal protein S9 [Chitinophagales bacterium]|jgi:small subunit ribosomal protein S9|nr:30S ribosomal protein S9 [Chitinophagales bacterium]HNI45795.1 30S ribosomal protein S9 [Chitinophagales bacterium]HNL06936.1 30S ribosomal protein S9 [Chitinophagales bacterium]